MSLPDTKGATQASTEKTGLAFDVQRVRGDFPLLGTQVHGKPLAYLDSAATSQKPQSVIDAVSHYYEHDNANIHRGVHELSARATEAYEQARKRIARWFHVPREDHLIYTRGTTEAINLVAQAYARPILKPGDEILITLMEHHSNIVPWQLLCEQTGATLRAAPISDHGDLLMDELAAMIGPATKIVAVVHVSNALGTINDVKQIVKLAHDAGAVAVVDGAQAVPHLQVDLADLDCDFYALSGHKLFGPTGIGVLYAKAELIEKMVPYQGGGEMIKSVTLEQTLYADPPHKFEAGTPHIVGAIGLGAAVQYLENLDFAAAAAHELQLHQYMVQRLAEIKGLRLIGSAQQQAAVQSFVLECAHAHDVGTLLDDHGVAVRTGHHCAQPVLTHFGVPATARASLAFYNTKDDIDQMIEALHRVTEVFT